jgi:hypothetical protein
MQQIKGEQDETAGLALGERGLQCREIRHALAVERNDLAVDQHVGKPAGGFRDFRELVGPVEIFASLQRRPTAGDPQLHPVAVELDLVDPAGIVRWARDRTA